MINRGDVVFFKKARSSNHRKAPEVTFKGNAFGILLGHAPAFAPNPPREVILVNLASLGFLSFDDIGEFLGDDVAAECVKKFEAKYLAPPDPNAPHQEELPLQSAQPEEELHEETPPTGLVDPRGKPIESGGSSVH